VKSCIRSWGYNDGVSARQRVLLAFLLAALVSRSVAAADPPRLVLNPHDHVAIIGNTLADRMQHFGHFETLLQHRFAAHELVVRNLGFSGDELTIRLRSAGFGSPDDHLKACQADVVLAFFGYNESFAGAEGLAKFKQDLAEFIKHTLGEKYNGKTAPRLILFSPIGHENLGDRNLPDGTANNARIEQYTTAMAEVGAQHKVPLVDLFAPTAKLYEQFDQPLTINGIHLNERGDRELATIIDRALFGSPAAALADAQRERTSPGSSVIAPPTDIRFLAGGPI
jgi:lysophospholipase L1-like esterase